MHPNKTKGRKSTYDEGLKIAVAREYITSNLTHMQLAEKYQIAGGTGWSFVRWYQNIFIYSYKDPTFHPLGTK